MNPKKPRKPVKKSFSQYRVLEAEDEVQKLRFQLSELRLKYNRERRWARALLCVHFGDEPTKSARREFKAELANL